MKKGSVSVVYMRTLLAPLVVGVLAFSGPHEVRAQERMVPALPEISSWGYQLQYANPLDIAGSHHDLVVIDASRDGTRSGAYTPIELARMQRKPDGGRRIVLAYLSIGEAEDYRAYWKKDWRAGSPPWIGAENPDWKGNFTVRFWHRTWQTIISGALDNIIAAGFDGVYFDRIDIYQEFKKRRGVSNEMIDFVRRLAAQAQRRKPGFFVVGQNAESLLRHPSYRAAISGVGKEDLLYGVDGDGKANSSNETGWSRAELQFALDHKLPVLVIEYLSNPRLIAVTREELRAQGFVPTFGVRALDRLSQ